MSCIHHLNTNDFFFCFYMLLFIKEWKKDLSTKVKIVSLYMGSSLVPVAIYSVREAMKKPVSQVIVASTTYELSMGLWSSLMM